MSEWGKIGRGQGRMDPPYFWGRGWDQETPSLSWGPRLLFRPHSSSQGSRFTSGKTLTQALHLGSTTRSHHDAHTSYPRGLPQGSLLTEGKRKDRAPKGGHSVWWRVHAGDPRESVYHGVRKGRSPIRLHTKAVPLLSPDLWEDGPRTWGSVTEDFVRFSIHKVEMLSKQIAIN